MALSAERRAALIEKYNFRDLRLRSNRVRIPLSERAPRKVIHRTETPAQKAQKKLARKEKAHAVKQDLDEFYARNWAYARELAQKYGQTASHWYKTLMQNARVAKTKRKLNLYNVFQSLRLEQLNADIPEGQPHLKSNSREVQARLTSEWRAMSKEEQVEVTKERAAVLEARRESADVGRHNVHIAAFHDVRATLHHVTEQLDFLNKRTDVEFLLLSSRGDMTQYNRPMVWRSSTIMDGFCSNVLSVNTLDLVARMEAYTLAGIKGVKGTYNKELKELRQACSSLIYRQCQELVSPNPFPKMHYTDFDEYLTRRHRVRYVGWPLDAFKSPFLVTSLVELRVLHANLESGATKFVKLTEEEYAEWRESRTNRPAPPTCPPSSNGNNNAGTVDQPSSSPGADQQTPLDNAENNANASADAQSLSASATAAGPSAPTPPSSELPGGGAVDASRGTKRPLEMIFTADGVVTKKPRKQRSDKGKKRGPTKRRNTSTTTSA
ncbi:hypothetical protein K474DRAFT_1676624 [Panus rudis PR-1116 ss-1]|nr:hypothetical protein K474DRAFT_1676624 [Panus rudis PR-1116 ss-1]